MKTRIRPWFDGCLLVAASLLLASCATEKQSITLAPVASPYAISASSSLLVNGLTIPESAMTPVKDIHFEKFYSAKLSEKEIRCDLSSDLKTQLEDAGANGIIRLRLKVTAVDTSAVSWIAAERYLGAMIALGGLSIASLPYSMSYVAYQSPVSSDWLIYGIGTAVVGAALFGGSWLHESVGTIGYTFEIDGTAVRYQQ